MKVRAARYGLRGTRVGEASHPGPRRRQVIPSTDDDLDSTFLDEFELDLNAPKVARMQRVCGSQRRSTPEGRNGDASRMELSEGVRPNNQGPQERDPTEPQHGWQKVASTAVHEHFRETILWPECPLASVPLTALPVHRVSRMDSEPFRVVLLRRLRLPLPFLSAVVLVAAYSEPDVRQSGF